MCFPYLESMDTFPSSILITFKLSSPIMIVLSNYVISLHIFAGATGRIQKDEEEELPNLSVPVDTTRPTLMAVAVVWMYMG